MALADCAGDLKVGTTAGGGGVESVVEVLNSRGSPRGSSELAQPSNGGAGGMVVL